MSNRKSRRQTSGVRPSKPVNKLQVECCGTKKSEGLTPDARRLL